MARKHELAVGQHRELKDPRRNHPAVARCEILELGVQAELYGGAGSAYRFWKLETDMVLVRVIEAHEWSWDNNSSRQTRTRAGKVTPMARYGHGRERRHETISLPDHQYLVKPSLIGSLWGPEQDEARRHDERLANAKRRYNAEVERQRAQLTNYFVGARVDATPISWGHSGVLSLNSLTAILNHVAGRKVIDEVHWRDYDPAQERASESA